ncbi:MAG: CPBP family intramembrane metalloprotease [Alphaproteobacteria bacterium]|nr:CPBP family intramembrane metalloprotease [Alphaproteobacteria bacterium]
MLNNGQKTGGSVVRRHPAVSYFVITFTISWLGALAVAAPYLLRGEALPRFVGLMMFPAMLLGPCLSGIVLSRLIHGPGSVGKLFARMLRIGALRWLVAVAIPPVLIAGVLLLLSLFVSPVFAPGRLWFGFSFGIAAGLVEEIGWSGFAFPVMRSRLGALAGAVVLGLLWSCWHLPVIDYLGAASPHGRYWLDFFLAFAAAMTALRVLISWVYANTESLLLSQLIHAGSTGSLVALGPLAVNPGQEALWYAAYAVALWLTVLVVVTRFGTTLTRRQAC